MHNNSFIATVDLTVMFDEPVEFFLLLFGSKVLIKRCQLRLFVLYLLSINIPWLAWTKNDVFEYDNLSIVLWWCTVEIISYILICTLLSQWTRLEFKDHTVRSRRTQTFQIIILLAKVWKYDLFYQITFKKGYFAWLI